MQSASVSISDDDDRAMIVHTMKFEKTLTGSNRAKFMDEAYKYKSSHEDVSMVKAKFEVSKTFKA